MLSGAPNGLDHNAGHGKGALNNLISAMINSCHNWQYWMLLSY